MLSGLSKSRVFLKNKTYTDIWHAVCEYSSDGVKPNISWVLPDANATQVTTEFKYGVIKVEVNSTLEFQLSQYEGKDLICLIQNNLGIDDKRTMRVPKYCKRIAILAQLLTVHSVNVFYLLNAIRFFPTQLSYLLRF